MATYLELYELQADTNFRNKVLVAVSVKAQELIDLASPTAAQLNWAKATLDDPTSTADQIVPYVLAANKGLTVAQIEAAADTAIQSNVSDAADKLLNI